jgi:hypothetical protein
MVSIFGSTLPPKKHHQNRHSLSARHSTPSVQDVHFGVARHVHVTTKASRVELRIHPQNSPQAEFWLKNSPLFSETKWISPAEIGTLSYVIMGYYGYYVTINGYHRVCVIPSLVTSWDMMGIM